MKNARSKVVFSLSLRDRNLAPLADWLYSGTFDPNRIKLELYSRKVDSGVFNRMHIVVVHSETLAGCLDDLSFPSTAPSNPPSP